MEPIRPLGPAEPIPVFNCQVLIGRLNKDPSQVRARVANLAGIEVVAESERTAMQQVVAAFKERVTRSRAESRPIPWLDPPQAAEPHEQTRLIAVHL